ncbi:MAG: sigma-70 family RNA polymerase sigma factor [bacterium]
MLSPLEDHTLVAKMDVSDPLVRASSVDAELNLAESYLTGNRDAYQQVDTWIHQVTALSIWHFVDDVEDVAATVQLKLFTNLKAKKFRGESTFRTYVQRIARYTCIDQVRSQRVVRDADPEELPAPSSTDDPETIHLQAEEREIFLKIFRLISTECQKLWRMIFSETLNYKEIGEQLGIPEGSVKRKVHECKKVAIELKDKLISPNR